MLPILITRPLHQAEALARLLKERGFTPILLEPLLTIHPCEGHASLLHEALENSPQAILITSANALDSLALLTPRRDIPILAVGESSRVAALRQGFTAHACGGDAGKLLAYIREHVNPRDGALLYASGEVINLDLSSLLASEGFTVQRLILYKAAATSCFSPATHQLFIARQAVNALFYSKRTAAIFTHLVGQQQAEYKEAIRKSQAFALSDPVASMLDAVGWKHIHVAEAPLPEAMIALLSKSL